jgi:hypothetical protein
MRPFGPMTIAQHQGMTLMSSVRERLNKYSPSERRRIHGAVRLMKHLAHAPPQVVAKMLREGGLINCPVTSQDIANAADVYGLRSIPSLRGRGVRTKGFDTYGIEPAPKYDAIEVKMYSDIMFVVGQAFLISVWLPVNVHMVVHIPGVKASQRKRPHGSEIRIALEAQLNRMETTPLKTIACYCDNEIGADGSEPRLALDRRQIPVYPCGADQHVPEIERRIRTVKERTRAILCDLPYTLPSPLLVWLLYFVVWCINCTPSSRGGHTVIPKELINGRKLSYNRDLRFEFGEYAEAALRTDNNVTHPRSQGVLLLLSSGSETGSVKCLHLVTKRIAIRDR